MGSDATDADGVSSASFNGTAKVRVRNKTSGSMWSGKEVMKMDNPYIIELDPQEFMEVWGSMTSELESTNKEDAPEHYELVKRVVEKLKQADEKHICDEK